MREPGQKEIQVGPFRNDPEISKMGSLRHPMTLFSGPYSLRRKYVPAKIPFSKENSTSSSKYTRLDRTMAEREVNRLPSERVECFNVISSSTPPLVSIGIRDFLDVDFKSKRKRAFVSLDSLTATGAG